jgi:hypothetical protein
LFLLKIDLSELCLNTDDSKRAYNWFHFSFDSYKENELCSPEDIMLMKRMERFLLDNGE